MNGAGSGRLIVRRRQVWGIAGPPVTLAEMTLLRDIQDAATGTDVPVATLLRKAQILAARLDHAPLREWASQELDGIGTPSRSRTTGASAA
jgi:hypothetical protein